MRTSGTALRNLNIIFFDFEILSTIWMTYVLMTQAKTQFFQKKPHTSGTVPKSFQNCDFPKHPELFKTVSTVLIRPLDHFYKLIKIHDILPFLKGCYIRYIIWTKNE